MNRHLGVCSYMDRHRRLHKCAHTYACTSRVCLTEQEQVAAVVGADVVSLLIEGFAGVGSSDMKVLLSDTNMHMYAAARMLPQISARRSPEDIPTV